MIVIIDRPGQLCNRLWAVTPFIALSLKYNLRLCVVNFNHYAHYFENVNRYKKIRIGLLNNDFSYRVFKKMMRTFKIENLSKKIYVHEKTAGTFRELETAITTPDTIHLIKSWFQPFDTAIISEYKNEIMEIFSPDIKTKKLIDHQFTNIREHGHIVIGVHIRRTDYKHFLDGKYLFADDVYMKFMAGIESELHKQHKKAVFILCSDSEIDMKHFEPYNVTKINPTSTIHDLYALSKCDYILGPPSTFSMWASFYGDVPLKFIHFKNEKLSLSDFSPIIARNLFKDGRIFRHQEP